MGEDIEIFIKTWNSNISKVDGFRHTYHGLVKFCISFCRKEIKKFSLRKLIIELNNKKEYYEEEIKSINALEEGLHFQYHSEKVKNESLSRKIIYAGQNNRGNEITFERSIEIINNRISISRITQKEIDLAIVKEYLSKDKNQSYDGLITLPNIREEFIFYQIDLYNKNINRIKKWFNLLKTFKAKEEGYHPDDLKFLSDLYIFFRDFNKIINTNEKLDLWFNKLIVDEKFWPFIHYFPKNNLIKFNEDLIELFKENYFQKLNVSFKINLKKSINKNDFLKIQIKDLKDKLNKEPKDPWSYKGGENHNNVYNDLVKGERDIYYGNIRLIKIAGETEAIVDFIKYLEGYSISNKRREVLQKENFSKLDFLPIELFENTRNYIKKNASQVNICYRHKAYDACFILLRKITEILIIEFYEKLEIEDKIKDNDGNYFMLKKLISSFQNEKMFKNFNSRSTNEILPRIKKNGDLSAHKRKFNARKPDIDRLRDDYRIVFEEFIDSIYN